VYSNGKANISTGDFFSIAASAELQISTDYIDMPRTAVGQKSIAKVRITNSSAIDDGVITFSRVYVSESSHIFLINGCRVLLPGRSCNWFIQFAPRQNQSYPTQLIFEGTDAGTGQVITMPITLVGRGFATFDPSRGGLLAGVSR
jgi:hypothetical protein